MVNSSVEWTDCPNISQSSRCWIFQIEYASKLLFHLYLLPHSRSSVPLACYFLSMEWTFTYLGLCLFSSLRAQIAMPFLTWAIHTRLSTSKSILFFHCLTDIYLLFPKKINPYLFSATLPYTYIPVLVIFISHPFLHSLYVYWLAIYW